MHNKLPGEPVVLFANPPPLQDLCAITVSVTCQVNHSQVASTWQPQILKCREIIFTEPDIIASPAFDMENCFHVVLQQSLFKTGKLQNRFQKIGLEASKPYRVTPALYQSCLRYTLLAKVAPTWNKAGEWLVHGRDFLTHTGYANAVKMNLTVNRDELFVSLLADCVKFPPLQLIDLDVDENVMHQLILSHPDATRDMAMFNCWCHVLPSMKRGRICSVSKNVPQDGPFRSYRDLKRHWKNTYGYRLPDTEEDMLFYEISFRQNGGKLFTYPSVCLRATQMQRIPRIDPKPILTSFIQDLHSKLSSICGHPLKFLPKVRYAIPELYESGQERNGFPPNLSNKNPLPSAVPLRNIKELSNMYAYKPPAPLITEARGQGPYHHGSQYPASSSQTHLTMENDSASSSRTSYDTSRPGISMADLIASQGSFSSTGDEKSISERPTQFIKQGSYPQNHFNRESTQSHTSDEIIPPSQNALRRIIPLFKPQASKSSSSAREVAPPKAVPVFKPKSKSMSQPSTVQNHSTFNDTTFGALARQSRDSATATSMTYPVSKPQLIRTAPTFAKKPTYASTSMTNCLPHRQQSTPQSSKKSLSLKQSRTKPHAVSGQSNTNLQGTPVLTGDYNHHLQSPSISGSTDFVRVVTSLNSNQSAGSLKRPTTEDDRESSAKKPRAKAQIQDVDVEMLARAHQLNKVNSVTLLAWLRKKCIPCKAKDKKADLVNQVYHMLNLQISET